MSSDQPRAFNAATNVMAYAQAFTTASVDGDGQPTRPRRTARSRSILRIRRHRTGR
jgi:hypothetical protein